MFAVPWHLDIAVSEGQVLKHHWCVLDPDPFTEADPHHSDHELVAWVGNFGNDIIIRQFRNEGVADGRPRFAVETGVRVGDQTDVAHRRERWLESTGIADQMDQRHQKGPIVTCFIDCCREIIGVARSETLTRLARLSKLLPILP